MRRLLSTVLTIGVAGSLAGVVTYGAFSSSTTNAGNSMSAGTVTIEDNDGNPGVAMLSLSNARPGDSDTSCIKVTYTGSLPASVRLYATLTGTLKNYLTLTVTRGTDATPTFDNCATFVPDATDYNGDGDGVVYSGLLSAFPATYDGGIVDPKAATPETWTQNEAHVYKFTISLNNDTAAQGLSTTAAFTWEARNE